MGNLAPLFVPISVCENPSNHTVLGFGGRSDVGNHLVPWPPLTLESPSGRPAVSRALPAGGWANSGCSPAFCLPHRGPANPGPRNWQRAEGEYVPMKGITGQPQRGRNRRALSSLSRLAVTQLQWKAGGPAWWELKEGSEEEEGGWEGGRIHLIYSVR